LRRGGVIGAGEQMTTNGGEGIGKGGLGFGRPRSDERVGSWWGCRAWAQSTTRLKRPGRQGVVRAMAGGDHWRCVSKPRWAHSSPQWANAADRGAGSARRSRRDQWRRGRGEASAAGDHARAPTAGAAVCCVAALSPARLRRGDWLHRAREKRCVPLRSSRPRRRQGHDMGLFPNIETARQRQRGARAYLCRSSPRSRSLLTLPIAAHALPGLRPLGLFLAGLRAVRRQGAREALLSDRVLAPRAGEPDRPGGDLPRVAGHTPHSPRRGMALNAHPLGLSPRRRRCVPVFVALARRRGLVGSARWRC